VYIALQHGTEPATARRGNGGKVVPRKYANRGLYDTEKNAYVTMNHVGDLIRQGRQVEVIAASTQAPR
jgi:polyhydroxyalkanoate synthesis regulator protein